MMMFFDYVMSTKSRELKSKSCIVPQDYSNNSDTESWLRLSCNLYSAGLLK